jgi:hypothetical protein
MLKPSSPYRYFYRGLGARTRIRGQGQAIKALAIDLLTLDGRELEVYYDGLRNAYDLAFNRQETYSRSTRTWTRHRPA